ncbi:uncharacterized protein SPSK_06903 [Sporothrix schenckii 1099-18]|uniref:CSC1/OSCA1-like 7TM region domain-containing protein n=2 Tax=Sporothrix schenckii TaxID=29908 RepID=U7PIY3_SPOS1|nr:uncharacterized protein SPSK_06903 [Sporothrix schenckii 1099-18]ERS94871.1 hypothetical protein HMPREF1624_08768 [Sporothrix schenckii ATCC 58251]KJR88983.1 hypothetical protein SPSK_06903 [Sporothrix schenckii 1099-18]
MDWGITLVTGLEKRLNQSQDPRIGSGRDNSTGGTLSHVTSSGTDSSSAASLGSTFVPVLVYSGVCLVIFFVFRRKCQRVYAPRTISSIRRAPLVPVPPLPDTWFTWLKDFWNIDEAFLLNNTSLDGFFFLRYLRVLATICFAGCIIAWPVLLSVNATGGKNLSQLDLLTIGDVASPIKFYAHVAIAWLFFGFILFMISRECIYYINLRQAYLMSPRHAQRLSSRTVLFTCVPKRFLDEHRVRKLFGDSVKNVWIPRNTRELERLVDEREKAAVRLEKAEIELIRKANRARKKKHGVPLDQQLPPPVSMAGRSPARSDTSSTLDSTSSSASAASAASAASSASSSSPSSHSSPSSAAHSPRPSTSAPAAAPLSPPPRASTLPQQPAAATTATTAATVAAAPPQRSSSSVRRASAASTGSASRVPTEPPQPPPAVSTSSTINVLQNTLSPGLIHEIREINQTNKIQEPSPAARKADRAHVTDDILPMAPDDRQGSFSDASGPSSATAVVSTVPPMSEITEIERAVEGPPNQDNTIVAKPATKEFADDNKENNDDEENEQDYIHPYGFNDTLPDVRGSVAAQWLPVDKRPAHRPLANFGRRVDTIRWTRMRIKSLNKAIAKLRRKFRAGDGDLISSMFVEFDTQAAAQVAFQVLTHHQPLHMSPRFIGIRPEDVIWSSLRMRWWERIMRRFLIMGAIAVGIVFWSIPAALVGIISNVSFLSSNVFFLHWIADIPKAITGVIEGLLPAVALSLLMAAVPGMLRICARIAGLPSSPMVELYTQHAYFCFQLIQVFLITTLTSAASAAFTQILADPLSIKDLLSTNLPKASNFYLSYITVQCLAGGAIGLVHFFDLFRHTVLNKTIQHPRRAVRNFQRLKQPHWGGIFPVYTNMGVIAISYTCIAPLILVFAGIGMCVVYQVYKYNLVYAFDGDRDSRGLHYPRGLLHLMIGLYLAEVCLIGLFSIQSAVGPVILMIMFLVFTFLVHTSLNDAVSPLLYSLPRTLALDDQDLAAGHEDLRRQAEREAAEAAASSANSGGLNADYYNIEEGYGEDNDSDDDLHAGPVTNRGIDGASELMGMVKDWGRDAIKKRMKTEVKAMKTDITSFSVSRYIPWGKTTIVRNDINNNRADPNAASNSDAGPQGELGADGQPLSEKPKPNFFTRWLHPELFEDYTFLRKTLVRDEQEEPMAYPADYTFRGYWPPEMWKPIPKLWIPRDDACVSRQEVAHTRKVVPITDRGAWLTAKGNVVADLDKAPFLEPIYLY